MRLAYAADSICTTHVDVAGSSDLQRYFSTFPAGAPGIGLLLLRLSLALSLLSSVGLVAGPLAAAVVTPVGPVGLATIVSLVLVLGLWTPLVAVALAVAIASAHAFAGPSWAAVGWHVPVDALVLALLGPGAYSLDARLFGRREILVSHEPRR